MSDHRLHSILRALAVFTTFGAFVSACAPSEGGITPRAESTEVEILRPIELTPAARLPEQDVNLIDVEVFEDRLIFTYSNPPTELLEIDHVVSGVLHGGYLRKITSVTALTPTRIETTTVHAELGELIGDGHFVVHMQPGDGDRSFRDPEGLTTAELDHGFSVLTPELRSISCGYGEGGSVTVRPQFDIDVGMDIDIDIQWSVGRFLIPRGELHSARVEMSGSVEAGLTVESPANTMISCTWNLADFAMRRGTTVPKREWTTTFPVGPVPVILTHQIAPKIEITVQGQIETGGATARATGRLAIRAGATYTEGSGWAPIWVPSGTGSTSLTPNMPGRLQISASFGAGIEYTVKLYDTFGPGFSFGPKITASFQVDPNTCMWTAEVKGAAELGGEISLTVPVIDYKLAGYSISQAFGETTWGMATGTLPWCEDAGRAPDAGTTARDSGTTVVRDGGGTSGDGGGTTGRDAGTSSDPCAAAGTDCASCNATAGCGFCAATGACTSDSQRSTCAATSWRDTPSECIDDCTTMNATCTDCMFDGFCGWCPGTSTCVTAPSSGGASPCAGFMYASGTASSCGP